MELPPASTLVHVIVDGGENCDSGNKKPRYEKNEESDSDDDESSDENDPRAEFKDYLEAWDELGRLAIAVGSSLIEKESAMIYKLCHGIEQRRHERYKRKYDGIDETQHSPHPRPRECTMSNDSTERTSQVSDFFIEAAQRRNVQTKVERMQRMAYLLRNLEWTHCRLRSEIQAIANGGDEIVT